MKSTQRRSSPLIHFVLLASLGFYSCSRPEADDHAAHSPAASTPPLFDDLGSHQHAITTSNETAQKYFDQGLRLVYGFNHEEAERAFLEVARLDPASAMAWWGVAVALGPNINLPLDATRNGRAVEAVSKAQALASGASEAERAYIEAIATRYSADPSADRSALDRAYSEAMRKLSERYPDDSDAAVLFAESLMDLKPWQLWTLDGKPQAGTEEIIRVLESVLIREPNHPGANHYYIHAVEASPSPERAAKSAERLRTLVPGAGHLIHMPAHIDMRIGNYAGAIEANAAAARADEAYFARTKSGGLYSMMYYTHNFMFLSAAAAMKGECARALDSAGKAVAIAAPMAGHEPMAEYVLPSSFFAMARCGRWDDILATARPADSTPSTLAFWHYARGLAHAGKGSLGEARKEREAFSEARKLVPADFTLNLNRAHDLLAIAEAVLDARIAAAAKNVNSAVAHWKRAITFQDALTYDEPPAWYYPIRESLGGEYLRARRLAEAEKVFREDLRINRGNPRSLFGLAEALRGQSKDPAESEQLFQDGWKNADVTVNAATL